MVDCGDKNGDNVSDDKYDGNKQTVGFYVPF